MLLLFNPARRFLVTIQTYLQQTKPTKGHNNLLGTGHLVQIQVFKILGISLEIPSISKSRYERPSISKFLIRNT